jgi:hypothetical protein
MAGNNASKNQIAPPGTGGLSINLAPCPLCPVLPRSASLACLRTAASITRWPFPFPNCVYFGRQPLSLSLLWLSFVALLVISGTYCAAACPSRLTFSSCYPLRTVLSRTTASNLPTAICGTNCPSSLDPRSLARVLRLGRFFFFAG